jgi:cyclase
VGLAKRIIPCLDVTAAASSRASTSSSCATPATRSRSRARYDEQGADELTFLDITASSATSAT